MCGKRAKKGPQPLAVGIPKSAAPRPRGLELIRPSADRFAQ